MREIIFFRTKSGGSPIEEFLDSLNVKQAKKVTWVLGLIEELERVPKQYLKKLAGTEDIWEIRVREGREVFRLLGFFDGSNFVVLVHAFKKKSRKIKERDLELAKSRKKEYLLRKKR